MAFALLKTAVLALVLSGFWLAVQRRWSRPGTSADDAAKAADHLGCHGCRCGQAQQPPIEPIEEEQHAP